MPGHDIVVVGASAGGVEALTELFSRIPPDFPASIFVVLHVPAGSRSLLPRILRRFGPLPVVHASDGEPIARACIYVAPPDRHLLVKRGHVRLGRGPRENSSRPAVDPLFRTAALAYGPRVVGVVLTGTLDDGTAGLHVVKQRGGTAVAQDPDEALYPGMPGSAIANVAVDHVLPLAGIAELLVRLAGTGTPQEGEDLLPDETETETGLEADIAEMDAAALLDTDRPGTPSGFSCPECHGVLWELHDGQVVRFRCRVGHAYSVETLLSEQSGAMEAALWTAFQALEERAALMQSMAERMRRRGQEGLAERYRRQMEETQARAALVRRVLLQGGDGEEVPDGASATAPAPSTG